jgi:multidrug efflux pump subunit AcrA (membrane-fusion protein)
MLKKKEIFRPLDEHDMSLERRVFKSLHKLYTPKIWGSAVKLILFSTIFLLCILIFSPWIQTSYGEGKIISYDPSGRIQPITALVSGRILKWYVFDGQMVKKNSPIVEITDNDPEFMDRLISEQNSIKAQLQSSILATKTGKLNLDRQKLLLQEGLTSRKNYEKAKIEYQKLIGYESSVAAKLNQIKVKVNRQKAQIIYAPSNGFVVSSIPTSNSTYVKKGQELLKFVPIIENPAIELYIKGYDLPFIKIGQNVRIQLEGWPALQFSGWPGLGIGSFAAKVSVIEQALSANGRFRIILTPSDISKWPQKSYLRQGIRVKGWVLMGEVKLWYELWRRLNSFPPKMNYEKEAQKNKE